MEVSWVEVEAGGAPVRRSLGGEPLELGEGGGELTVPGAGDDRLLVSGDPPRAVFKGAGEAPRLRGKALRSARIAAGDVITWHRARISFGGAARSGAAQLQPLSPDELSGELPGDLSAGASGVEARGTGPAWRRIKAGLVVELGLAERGAARRAQDSVVGRSFDPDEAARELLAGAGVSDDDPRLAERSTRLMRDLVMAPAQRGARGASRRVRQATRSGMAWFLTQFMVVGFVAVLVAALLVVARLRWGFSMDGVVDRALELVTGD